MNTIKSVVTLALLAALVGCTGPATTSPSGAGSTVAPTESKTLTVVTHDSFSISDELKKQFAQETGYTVTYEYAGRTFTEYRNRPPTGDTIKVRVNVVPN